MHPFLKSFNTAFLALVLAALVWIAAIREQNPPREDNYSQPIPVTVVPAASGLVTTDSMPETVRLRLMAPESSWNTLRPSKFKAYIDLSGLPAGFNDVPVQVDVSDPQIKIIEQEPELVTVNLQAEKSISLPVNVVILDGPPIGYINRAPVAEPATVELTGPASVVNQVDKAVCEILIRNAKETVVTTHPVQILGQDNQSISGLKVTPSSVGITVPIEQRFGYKDVSVSAVIEGQVAPGYWVSNVSVDPPTLTIVGNPRVLGSIPGFIETVPVNLNMATENVVRTVPLNLPDGVTVILSEEESEGASGVTVKVAVAAIESGQTMRLPVSQQGIDPAYTWSASPEEAEVILSGTIPRLQALRPNEVKVLVDLFGLEPGVYKIEPTVFVPDGLRVEAILPQVIEIVIGSNASPLSTPEPSSSASSSPLPTPTASPTATSETGTGRKETGS